MYNSSRRYHKNDWWDFMIVIDQELEKDHGPQTYYYILDELKWRLVDSISEGSTYKIKKKVEDLKMRLSHDRKSWSNENTSLVSELDSLVSFFN